MQSPSEIKSPPSYFQSLFRHAAIGIIVTNSKGNIDTINPFALNMFGYSECELLDKNISLLIPSRFHDSHQQYHDVYFKNPKTRPMGEGQDIFAVTKNGIEFPAQVSLAVFNHDKKSFTIAYISDDSERKKKEEQLWSKELYTRLLIEHSPSAIAMLDNEMRYVIVSRRWLKDYRLGDCDITGLCHYDLFPETPEDWRQIYERCLTGEEFSFEEEAFLRSDGKVDWIKWEACPWYINNKNIGGLILFTEVITGQKQEQIALKQLNEDLEKRVDEKKELSELLDKEKNLNDLKTRFVSMASHEFRTPLSTILSSAYLIEKYTTTKDQPKREKHLERISASVALLSDTLNDFLSVGKIEEGKIHVKLSVFNLKDIIQSTLEELKNILKPGQNILYHHTGEENALLDPSMLKHIVINLISNASKFSSESMPIHITTRNGDTQIHLSVKDQGIGIPPNEMNHLMERFHRCSNAVNIQGTGLGLHIVLKYTELMNGKIDVESELDTGTQFNITFTKNI